MTIAKFKAIPLELVSVSGTTESVFNMYKKHVDSNALNKAVLKKLDFRRWRVMLDAMIDADSLLDIGTGLGQLANIAALSGTFTSIIAADRKLHSQFFAQDGVTALELDIFAAPNPEYRADIVVFQGRLTRHSTPAIKRALQNLHFLAKKQLLVILPYNVTPLPEGEKRTFTMSQIQELMPDGDVTLIMDGAIACWAMVEINFA